MHDLELVRRVCQIILKMGDIVETSKADLCRSVKEYEKLVGDKAKIDKRIGDLQTNYMTQILVEKERIRVMRSKYAAEWTAQNKSIELQKSRFCKKREEIKEAHREYKQKQYLLSQRADRDLCEKMADSRDKLEAQNKAKQEKFNVLSCCYNNRRSEHAELIKLNSSLRKENDLIDKHGDSELCSICLDKSRSIVLTPCGHYNYCIDCAMKIEVCSICRGDICRRIRIY